MEDVAMTVDFPTGQVTFPPVGKAKQIDWFSEIVNTIKGGISMFVFLYILNGIMKNDKYFIFPNIIDVVCFASYALMHSCHVIMEQKSGYKKANELEKARRLVIVKIAQLLPSKEELVEKVADTVGTTVENVTQAMDDVAEKAMEEAVEVVEKAMDKVVEAVEKAVKKALEVAEKATPPPINEEALVTTCREAIKQFHERTATSSGAATSVKNLVKAFERMK